MVTVVLFGANCVIGQYIFTYLTNHKYVKTICVYDNIYNPLNDTFRDINDSKLKTLLVDTYKVGNSYVIINALEMPNNTNILNEINMNDYFKINTQFPHALDKLSDILNCKFIHITNNDIFNTSNGHNDETEYSTDLSPYGISKSLGESLKNACIIRADTISENDIQILYTNALNSPNHASINGYYNHYWNGITCLKLASIIYIIIHHDLYWRGVRHFFSNTISHYNLTEIINEIYNLKINIIKTKHNHYINRTLSSVYTTNDYIDYLLDDNVDISIQLFLQKDFNITKYYNDFTISR
jgi:dTDP-4-dehydrorhamnose reductase